MNDSAMFAPSDTDDRMVFAEEDSAGQAGAEPWKVLIIDDEPQIHSVTRLALQDFTFHGRGLEIISAYSAEEARKVLLGADDIALAFVDVVMEKDDAGLQLVQFIREDLQNSQIRLILRTGQPGMAPERFIIENYDIDDYKAKTEMTAQKLYTSVVGGLRAYKEIMRIEKIVEKRTTEIREINEELQTINNDLLDSINYARRIQLSILPSSGEIRSLVPHFFVVYEAKDIVSGDFYWFYHRDDEMFFAAIDCTGHGVPGAFMSVLGYSLLNQVVSFEKVLEPANMLERLRKMLVAALHHQHQEYGENINNPADGMDIALCKLNRKTLKLQFAGARRPLIWFNKERGMELVEGTRSSIGIHETIPFEQHEIQLAKGDRLYIFTDGITDQFGGASGRKLTPPRFREFLQQIQGMPFNQHHELIRRFYHDWKGPNKQTDDVLVMGTEL